MNSTTLNLPIGVFDSGVGGLTVLKAIRSRLPHENLLYLGDTARLPYGTKSPVSVSRYAQRASAHLRQRGVKMLVIACNTASAVALRDLEQALAPLPVIGVLQPGAATAVARCPSARHLVLATDATVRLGAYGNAIRTLDHAATVQELACEMLVTMAEEGWTHGRVAEAIIDKYLRPRLSASPAERPQSLILGCTHFPILEPAIRNVVGDGIKITDSAGTTADAVGRWLDLSGLARVGATAGKIELLATDGVTRFARVGGAFLGESLAPADIELVDL